MIPLTLLDTLIGGYDSSESVDLSGLSTHFVALFIKEKMSGSRSVALETLLGRCKHLTLKKEELSRLYTILVRSRIWSDAEFYRAFLKYYILNNVSEAKTVLCRALDWIKETNTDLLSDFFLMHLEKGSKGHANSAKIAKFIIENPFPLKSSFKSMSIMQLLIDNGANINDTTFFGHSFLKWSLDIGHIYLFESLLSKKASISCLFNPSPSPSLIDYLKRKTKCQGSLTAMECIDKLLKLNVKIDINESLAGSLLEKAIYAQDVDFAQGLINKGVNPNACNSDGMTPLLIVSSTLFNESVNQIELITLLLGHGADLLAVSRTSEASALHFMCSVQSYLETIEFLLKKGFPVDLADKFGLISFDYAVKNENIPLMLKLIEYGSKGMSKYSDEDLLFMVVDQESIPLLKKLLERGCSIDILVKHKSTLLLHAADGTNINWVKFLVENKANVNFSSLSGNTPLMKSIDVDFPITRCLIENGARIFTLKENGKCAADYMFLADIPQIVAYLVHTFLDIQQLQAFMPFSLNNFGLKELSKALIKALETHSLKLPTDLFPFLCFSILFNFSELSSKIFKTVPSNQLKETLVRLYKVFPELLENTPYLMKHSMCLQKEHLLVKEMEINVPPAPKDATLERLLTLFKEINFTDSSKYDYLNPAKIVNENGSLMPPETLEACLKLLCDHIKHRKARVGTPPPDTPEIRVFYAKLENYLKHISFQLDKMGNTTETAFHLIDIALAAEFCGMRWLGDIYDKYILLCHPNHFVTFKDQIYHALTTFRSGLVTLISGEDVHDYSRAIRLLGAPLGIPGSHDMAEINDRLRPNENGVPFKHMYRDFLNAYKPYRIYELVESFLNEGIKKNPELMHGWFRENIPVEWRNEYFNNLNNSLSKAESVLSQYDEILIKNEIPPIKRIEDLAKHLQEYKIATFFDEDFYDPESNKVTRTAILIVLKGLNILTECRWGFLEALDKANTEERENRKNSSENALA